MGQETIEILGVVRDILELILTASPLQLLLTIALILAFIACYIVIKTIGR